MSRARPNKSSLCHRSQNAAHKGALAINEWLKVADRESRYSKCIIIVRTRGGALLRGEKGKMEYEYMMGGEIFCRRIFFEF